MTLPNLITLFRILLVPFFFTTLVSYQGTNEAYRWIAFAIFVTAVCTDAIDGFIARFFRLKSDLGRFLDPLADKLLLLSAFLGLLLVPAFPYRPPLWVTVTIVFRDLVIVVGLIVVYLNFGVLRIQPNLLGKMTTAIQMLTFIAILLKWPASIPLWYVTAGLTILSLLVYVIREFRRIA